MSCQKIVPFTKYDMASGADLYQGRKVVIKTEDGTLWITSDKSPAVAASANVTLGHIRGDKICDR